MPLPRKLVIFAIAEGLILQTNGSQSQALKIEWKTAKLTPWKATAEQYRGKPYVESHGIVGIQSKGIFSSYG